MQGITATAVSTSLTVEGSQQLNWSTLAVTSCAKLASLTTGLFGAVETILQWKITSVLQSQHQAMPSLCRQTRFSRMLGVLESGPSYQDTTRFLLRLSCRVFLFTQWARAKSCDCGMARIWWVILKATMEDWSAAMFTLFMSEILSPAKIGDKRFIPISWNDSFWWFCFRFLGAAVKNSRNS